MRFVSATMVEVPGIVGTLDLEPCLEPAAPFVARMAEALAHRGAGCTACLDVSGPPGVGGPLRLALDGDVVNVAEVAGELSAGGYVVDGASQVDVVLAAWAAWGPGCLERLNGRFALAVWDDRSRRLICARDRFGFKPLYYTVSGGRFRFASEIKGLLAAGDVPREPNDVRILQYLAHGFADHTAETMLRGIFQVPTGAYVEVSPERGVERVTQWYRLEPAPADGPVPEQIRRLLADSVSLRLGGGVVGATLSGGLDSSSVLATAAQLRRDAGEEPPLAVIARAADPRVDERRYAQTLLDRYEIPCVEVRPDDLGLVEDFDAFVWALDEPCHSPSVYGHWKVMQAARAAGIDVILEGQGGDIVIGGVDEWYPQFFYDMLRRGRLGSVRRELVGRRRVRGVPASRSLLDLGKLLLPPRVRAAHRPVPAWIRHGVEVEPPPFARRGLLVQHIFETTVFDGPLLCREIDRDTSSHGLEERSPFWDHRLVEYARSLPPEVLRQDGWEKAPLRAAMRGIVPDEILDRRDKQGFTVDQEPWVRGAFGDAVQRTFHSEPAADRPYWDAAAVLELLADCREGRARVTDLWRIYSVERWLELVVDPVSVTPPEPVAAGGRI